MKLTKKTLAAIKAKGAGKKATKLNVSKKTKAAVAYVHKGATGVVVLLVSGSKGQVFRKATCDKAGNVKLTHDIRTGVSYDGISFNLGAVAELKRDARTELGCYVAGRGSKATVEVLTVAQAEKLASNKIKIERHNGKEVSIKVTKHHGTGQYAGSFERWEKTGAMLFGQFETKRLAHGLRHFGAIVKG